MVRVNKTTPPAAHFEDIYLSFFYGAKIGIIGTTGQASPRDEDHRRIGRRLPRRGGVVGRYTVGYCLRSRVGRVQTVREVVEESTQEIVMF